MSIPVYIPAEMNVSMNFYEPFVEEIKKLNKLYGPRFAELNGFSENQLNYSNFIDNFIDEETMADATIDSSANVGSKDICSLQNEMHKPHAKLMAFNKFFWELDKKYGRDVAVRWLHAEWDGHFYMHDAHSASWVPYCYAYDIEKLINSGLFFIDQFNNQAPKHLTTYTDFVGEFVSWVSNRTSGACGLPSFLIYSYYFWKKDCEEGYVLRNPEYYRDQEFQRIIYKLNQPYLRITQSAFTNVSIFDRPYLEGIFGGKKYPDGSYIIDHTEEIIEYQKAFMRVVSEIRGKNMMTFPVLTYSLLRQNGKFVDEPFAKWCCEHNMLWADSNFFISEDINSLSNCCRLLSDVKQLGYFNSIGGSALEVGSVKVNTMNLARLAYEASDIDDYLNSLKFYTVLCCQILDRVRHTIKRNIDKGLLPNYVHQIINMKSQYNTIGIIGIYEALQHFGMVTVDEFGNYSYTDEGVEFAKTILKTITDVKNEFAADTDYSINIEEIPGEKAAATLMEKDRELYPDEAYDLPLYGNQWIPLGVKTTLAEKIRLSAILDKACSGGSIAHINIDAPFNNFDTAWNLLNHIADEGVVYFAFNLRISACENNHGFYGEVCPHCGSPKVTSYQRIVGYLVPTNNYSKARKAEFAKRDWFEIERLTDV